MSACSDSLAAYYTVNSITEILLTNSTDVCYMTCSQWIFILENISSRVGTVSNDWKYKGSKYEYLGTFRSFSCWLKPLWKGFR